MIFRIVFMFVVLSSIASVILYAATCTNFFDKARLKRLALFAAIGAVGGFIAFFLLAALVALNA